MLPMAPICGTHVSTDTYIVHIFNMIIINRKLRKVNTKSTKILYLQMFSMAQTNVCTVRVTGKDKEDGCGRQHSHKLHKVYITIYNNTVYTMKDGVYMCCVHACV